MISHRILSCVFLILLSQYGDALKSRHVESILNSLQRIENLLVKQAEQQTLNCIISELSKSSNNESNEAQPGRKHWAPLSSDNILILRRTLDLDDEDSGEVISRFHRLRNKNKNRNENANINTNTNTNTNQMFSRRALDISHQLNKDRNRNVNYNVNTNVNKNSDLDLDLSEDEN